MGAGIFLLPSSLATFGSISLLGWIVTAFGAVMLSLLFVRLDSVCENGSGLHAYTREGLGRYVGSQVVYGYWVATWIGNIAVAISGVGYLSYFFPALTNQWNACFAAIGVIWALSFLNMRDIRIIGWFQVVTSSCMMVPVLIVGVLGWGQFDSGLLTDSFNVSDKSVGIAFSETVTLTLWSFVGLESACNLAGHAKNPKRDVPCATLLGTLLAAFLYILSTTAMMGIVPNEVLQQSAAPFSMAARYLLGDWAGELVSVMAIIACFGSLNGWILMQSQVSRSAAKDGLLPKVYGQLNRYGAPAYGLMITGVMMSVLLVLTIEPTVQKHFEFIVLIAVYIMLLAYFCACLACFQLQRRHATISATSIRWNTIILFSIGYCLWGVSGASQAVFLYGTVLIGAGGIVYWSLHRGKGELSML